MGEAIIRGLLDADAVDSSSIVVAEPLAERRQEIEAAHGVRTVEEAALAAAKGDVVLLAVKPQVLDDVVETIADAVGDALVISIAAGIPTARLESGLAEGTSVVRVMPNTPAMVGEGMSVVSGGTHASDAQVTLVRDMFGVMGRSVVVPEDHQDLATAISGSGPAYVARFIDALASAGQKQGLPREVALELALQTAHGTAHLLAEGGMTPAELIEGVSSPGGTTVAALEELSRGGFDETIDAGVDAAVRRAKELGS
jgi:pyrroline-5-carboxylate reductase